MKTALSAILLSLSLQAHAMLFEWSGSCLINCTGVAHAVFTVRDDYVPGTLFQCGDFGGGFLTCPITHVTYFDNTRTTDFIDFAAATGFHDPHYLFGTGLLPASPFDPGWVRLGFYADNTFIVPFWSTPDSWAVSGEDRQQREFLTQGAGGRFSTALVPEPGTLALIALFLMRVMRRAE